MNAHPFPPPGSRVVVAMSGGVDSSVAAALLVEQGYDVVGMMLRLWNDDACSTENRCCTPEALAEARRVAARLGIPFYAIDAADAFYERVVKPFIAQYGAGVTPNPCLLCNSGVRWQALLEEADLAGASALATGHYAHLERDAEGHVSLRRARDSAKDQSYVLAFLSQEQLRKTHFPLHGLTKPEVRAIAAKLGLSVAERPDSQDLCFAGGNYRTFLERHAPASLHPGTIVDTTGRPLGRHAGLALFTIGQRKGLGLNSLIPLYVVGKDLNQNTLVVGPSEALGESRFRVGAARWIAGSPPGGSFRCEVKTRYKSEPVPALVALKDDCVEVETERPIRDITPGQGAVFYSADEVLGAGTILNHK